MAFRRESARGSAFGEISESEGRVAERGLSQKQGLLDHLSEGEYLALVLDLDRGDHCGNCRCHRARYGLLERGVHNLGVSCNFLEKGDCCKKLV